MNLLSSISNGLQGLGGAIKSGFESGGTSLLHSLSPLHQNTPPPTFRPNIATSILGGNNPALAQVSSLPTAPTKTVNQPVANGSLTNSNASSQAINSGPAAVSSAPPAQNASTPSGFTIDTSNPTTGDMKNPGQATALQNQYQQYLQALAQAQQYSPDYINAYQGVQAADLRDAQLNSNYYTGNNLPGDTLSTAQGYTTREQALNAINKLGAQQALNTQALIRQGNIAGLSSLVQNSKETVSPGSSVVDLTTGQPIYSGLGGYQAVQGIQTVNNLAQTYPDAGIVPTDDLSTATAKAQQSPSFQSRQTIQITLPGGGIALINKNQLQTNPTTGQQVIISSADAASAQGYQSIIQENRKNYGNTQAAIATADANFPLLLQYAKQAGFNNGSPLQNQIEQAVAKGLIPSTAFAQFQTMVASLQTEYSRILSRGGPQTDKDKTTSQALINGTYSLNQLQGVYQTVKQESANVLSGYQTAITSAQQGLQGIYGRSTPLNGGNQSGGGSGIGSSWDSL